MCLARLLQQNKGAVGGLQSALGADACSPMMAVFFQQIYSAHMCCCAAVGVARAAAVCLAELLKEEKVQASGLLGALGAGACSPDLQVCAASR